MAFALRMRSDADLEQSVGGWLEAEAAPPAGVPAGDWLRWEQLKHQKLLAALPTPPQEKTAA